MASTIDDYLAAAAQQMAARGQLLLAKIPRTLPLEYGGLVAMTRDRLSSAITKFTDFAAGSVSTLPAPLRQRLFRRLVDDLDLIESIALTALHRAVGDDHRLTALIRTICKEIAYPLPPPVVTALSTQYYAIYPFFQLLLVPLTEGNFLLHLPDLYHELAHPLLTDKHDPLLDPFRKRFRTIIAESTRHFEDDIAAIRRGRLPPDLATLSTTAEYCWARSWATEFFCDLFAVSTVGPAFAWAHLHLHSKRGRSAYAVPHQGPTSHPADAARMTVIVSALGKLGFAAEAAEVELRWSELMTRMEEDPPPEFYRCYPDALLGVCVTEALAATREIGCDLASPGSRGQVRTTLHESWKVMWRDPAGYLDWEQRAVEDLHAGLKTLP
jgi:hypothetical protein